MSAAICIAIRERRLIRLSYDGGTRVVEPHAYGLSTAGHDILRAYQDGGTSQSGSSRGWKLFRVDQVDSLNVLDDRFSGPRPGYKRGDRDMTSIYCQL